MNYFNKNSAISLLFRLMDHLSVRRRRQLIALLGLMLLSAVTEVVSLGAVLPFLGVLINPDKVFEYPWVEDVARTLGVGSAAEMVGPLTALFILAALFSGAVRLVLLWSSVRLSNLCGADLGISVYNKTLRQPYMVHLMRNSSVVISGINKVVVAQAMLHSMLTVVNSLVLLVFVMSAIIAINAKIALAAVGVFGIGYSVLGFFSKMRLEKNSLALSQESIAMLKIIQEGLGGIRDILLDGSQAVYCKLFRKSQLTLTNAQSSNQFLSMSPRQYMEVMGIVLIATVAYYFSQRDGGVAAAMPTLGAMALGAQRMLPATQQLFSAWAGINGNLDSLLDALELLDQKIPKTPTVEESGSVLFNKDITFKEIAFRYYSDGPLVLDHITLAVPKGGRVALVGSTGSGKSTALDLLMGLLTPVSGQLLIDGLPVTAKNCRVWQQQIAHVPQTIFLGDNSLMENIAFGVPVDEIDVSAVKEAASRAQIDSFIEKLADGYHTEVGERGVRLSGGQRQRIGIARAFYKKAAVLVLDEATSALDNTTEKEVVKAIENLDREVTVFWIAHRLSTVSYCDNIFELENGRIVASGTYEQLYHKSASFRQMAMHQDGVTDSQSDKFKEDLTLKG
jgi:ATP-binding cassette, subfamily B, bacterial PglK